MAAMVVFMVVYLVSEPSRFAGSLRLVDVSHGTPDVATSKASEASVYTQSAWNNGEVSCPHFLLTQQ